MNCIWSDERTPEGWLICPTCHVPYKGKADRPKRNCAASPRGNRSAPRPSNGPGGQLLRLLRPLKWFAHVRCQGACETYAAKMDQWGCDECERRTDEIIAHLVSQANEHIPLAFLAPHGTKEATARWAVGEAIKRAREAERKALKAPPGNRLEWVSLRRMVADLQLLVHQLPPDVSGIVGVPRSGMVPASHLACLLHRPLYSFNRRTGLMDLGHGYRLRDREREGRLAVIDDTINTGYSIRENKKAWRAAGLPDALWVGLHVTPKQVGECDVVGRELAAPHLLEWNAFSSMMSNRMAMDFDGIICRNPPESDLPLYLPRRDPVPMIITARPESQREATKAWMRSWGVQAKRLVMWPHNERERSPQNVAEWKAEHYRKSGCHYYVESEPAIARMIHQACGLVVICPTNETVYQ